MAITVTEVQVLWSASVSQSVSSASTATSDAATINQACFQAQIMVKADNNGTPASGDYVDLYWLPTLGDPDADADSADEYATTTYGQYLGKLDTVISDPCIGVFPLLMPCEAGKLYVVNQSSGRSITVSAQILEQRG